MLGGARAECDLARGGYSGGIIVTNEPGTGNFVVANTRDCFQFKFLGDLAIPHGRPGMSVQRSLNRPGGFSDVFQMRTFLSTLYAVAREERYYEDSAKKPADAYGLKYERDSHGWALKQYDRTMARPILALTGYQASSRTNVTEWISVSHHGRRFVIADDDDIEQPDHRVFALLSVLFAAIAIDPQKLPVQQLIQVR